MITYQVTQPYVVADHSLLQILVYGANLPSLSPKVSGELYEQQDYDGLEIRPVTQFKSSNNHGNASCEVGENYEDDPEDDGIVSPNSDEKDDFDESRSADSESSPAGQRTVFIRGLPDRATHQDVVDASERRCSAAPLPSGSGSRRLRLVC
ncbi:hypothetical protein LV164_003050 [Aspergillus fumigatus]|nr:hypothetical protein KXV47_002705 [Aspergillus fumigatus]KAH2755866.1 hypothetical protein KXV94_000446 [Aspergillus fumigatus]KAH3137701.1 hypothetical protein KXW18_005199 [Aspergillus fumigatus]KAJ8198506.1 hypothetical protein LV157_000811 [Aspergillus fumigatus]KAJ8211171.1 hypothetical protein LV164_003050 [Aspergillus fumigatus]